jgi:hypothetical protein
MIDGRVVIYAIALLIVTGVAAVVLARVIAFRRRQGLATFDDDIDRPLHDIPLLFSPRAIPPEKVQGSAPHPAQAGAEADSAPRPAPALAEKAAAAEVAPAHTDVDGTMQLLPGRLEPLNHDVHQEIRFVKMRGINRFTFGRSPGPPYEHVQLRAATASRMHAYMVFDDSRWRIGNLSETNRVVVNGAPLSSDHVLQDGDRIEFGEIAFVFRER